MLVILEKNNHDKKVDQIEGNSETNSNTEPTSSKRKKKRSFLRFGRNKHSKSYSKDISREKSSDIQKRKLYIKKRLRECLNRLDSLEMGNNEEKKDDTSDDIFKNVIEHRYKIGGIVLYVYQQNIVPLVNIKHTFVTIHDIAHTYKSNFREIFSNEAFRYATQHNTVIYHICLPGQEPNSNQTIVNYPSFTELSRILTLLIIDSLEIESCIGFGVGAGGDLLIRSSLIAPTLYSQLILVNVKFRTIDKFKVMKYPFIFNPLNNHLSDFGINYFESRCTKSFCASTVNMEPVKNYKKTLESLKSNINLSNLVLQYWKRPDLDYYSEEAFKKHEFVPKIILKPPTLFIEGLISPSKNTRGDILDFVYPNKRVYRSFENGSLLVLDEFTDEIVEEIFRFIDMNL